MPDRGAFWVLLLSLKRSNSFPWGAWLTLFPSVISNTFWSAGSILSSAAGAPSFLITTSFWISGSSSVFLFSRIAVDAGSRSVPYNARRSVRLGWKMLWLERHRERERERERKREDRKRLMLEVWPGISSSRLPAPTAEDCSKTGGARIYCQSLTGHLWGDTTMNRKGGESFHCPFLRKRRNLISLYLSTNLQKSPFLSSCPWRLLTPSAWPHAFGTGRILLLLQAKLPPHLILLSSQKQLMHQ